MTETFPAIEGRVIEYQGKRYPRVTTILQECGLIDYTRVPEVKLELAAWRGSAVHQACLYDDQGDLDESTVLPEHWGYLEAWRAAKKACAFEMSAAEVRLTSLGPLAYTGQPDRWGSLAGGTDETSLIVLDIKTCPILHSVRWQLAAYANLLPRRFGGPVPRRIAVKLKGDGTYQFAEFPRSEYQRDLAVFNAALQIWWAKEAL